MTGKIKRLHPISPALFHTFRGPWWTRGANERFGLLSIPPPSLMETPNRCCDPTVNADGRDIKMELLLLAALSTFRTSCFLNSNTSTVTRPCKKSADVGRGREAAESPPYAAPLMQPRWEEEMDVSGAHAGVRGRVTRCRVQPCDVLVQTDEENKSRNPAAAWAFGSPYVCLLRKTHLTRTCREPPRPPPFV